MSMVLGPQLGTDASTKDQWKDPEQCVQNFCENYRYLFRSVVWVTATFFAALLTLTTLKNVCFFLH